MKRYNSEGSIRASCQSFCLPFSFFLTSALLFSANVQAKERVLEEVVVTAEKQVSVESRTPVSMTVLSEGQLKKRGIHDSMGISRSAPNLSMIRAGNRSEVGFMSIRGSTNAAETENHAVGFFVDSVPQTLADTEFLDVERIEILRGPQSTLYGRNSQAGVINVISNKPQLINSLQLNAGVESNNTQFARFIVGGALGEAESSDWSYRLATKALRSDGDFESIVDGQDDVDRRRDYLVRGKLRWNPRNGWDVIATVDRQRYRDRANSLVALAQLREDSHKVDADFDGAAKVDVDRYLVEVNYDLDSMLFSSTTSVSNEKIPAENDVDFTREDMYRLFTHTRVQRQTQEFRLSSPQDSGLDWLVGLYLYNQKYHGDYDFEGRPGSGFAFTQSVISTVDTTNMAVFGQVKWPLSELLSLTTGLRYDYEKQEIQRGEVYIPEFTPASNASDQQSANSVLPKLGLEYFWSNEWLLYANLARGYKAGGYSSTAPIGQEHYEAEYSNNYELGAKFQSAGKTLSSHFSLYRIDWSDQQIEVQAFPTGSITKNAGESHSEGVELETQWLVSDSVMLQIGLGLNNTKFDRYFDALAGLDYAGNRPPNAPDFTYGLSADYQFNESIGFRADWQVRGDTYYDSANSQKESSYGLLNISTRYQWNHYSLRFWVDNALGEVYATRAFDSGGVWVGRAGESRSVGISISGEW